MKFKLSTKTITHNDIVSHTTKFKTRPRTLSPISGEISEPNCCNVVRKRFNLLSCLAPHAGGSWFAPLPTVGGDVVPSGLVWEPFTWGDVELTDLVSAVTAALEVTGDTECRGAGWLVPSFGESGILESWVSKHQTFHQGITNISNHALMYYIKSKINKNTFNVYAKLQPLYFQIGLNFIWINPLTTC